MENLFKFHEVLTFLEAVSKAKQYDFGIAICDEILDEKLMKFGTDFRSIALSFRGELWEKKGQYDKAITDYTDGKAFKGVAWLLATCPDSKYRDGAKAVEYAKKLIEDAEKEDFTLFNILAAAYAEEGNFQEAIETQEKAMVLLIEAQKKAIETFKDVESEAKMKERKEGQERMREDYEKRLASYKAGEPWRMEPPK